MEYITIEKYVDAVESTLQYWLDCHTQPKKWAEGWIVDDDVEYTFKESPVISNNYFTFEWRKSALRREAKKTRHMYNICKNCGMMNDGFDCCEDVKLGKNPTITDLTYWLEEVEAQPTNSALMESLVKDGFKVYREALKDIIAPVVDEVKDVIKAIRRAKTNEDRLQAVLWGTRVYHVHGNIMSDYGDRSQYEIDYKMIDNIRNNGLNSVFSNEEITEYLES